MRVTDIFKRRCAGCRKRDGHKLGCSLGGMTGGFYLLKRCPSCMRISAPGEVFCAHCQHVIA